MKLQTKCAVITGASQGFGLEVAKQFVQEGADVVICARSAALLQLAKQELLELAAGRSKVLTQVCDVAKADEVDALIATTLKEIGKIDILVANAGVYGPKGPIEEVDWDEWSLAIDINLKGTVLQCKSVLPHFKQRRAGKIIVLSGGGATKPMPFLSAYAASKAAVVRFAETLAEEVKKFGIDVNTVAPGALNTRLLNEVLQAGPEKVGEMFYQQSLEQQQQGGTPLSVGASLCVFLASEHSNRITGKLISAVWDPWQKLPTLIDDLNQTDIYTLRRIVPEDRAKNWSDAT